MCHEKEAITRGCSRSGGGRTRAETFNFRCAELTILQTLFGGVDGVFPGEHVRIDGKCNCLEVFYGLHGAGAF